MFPFLLLIYEPSHNYNEFLTLTIIFLGGFPKGVITLRKPWALSKAHWMNRTVHNLKIYLFQRQFTIYRSKEKAFEKLCIFIVTAYVKAWFLCLSAVSAPVTDLEFFKVLKSNMNKGKFWQAAF